MIASSKDIMEQLRQVRALDPEAVLGCPRCLEEDRGSVPGARLNWRGFKLVPPRSPLRPTSQPQIRAARDFCRHLEEVHGIGPSHMRRKDFPVILYSARGYQAVDLLLHHVAKELISVS